MARAHGFWIAALVVTALAAATALAQAPAAKAPPEAGKAPGQGVIPPGGRPEAHFWWNDPEVISALSLTPEQRAKMDRIQAKELPKGGVGENRLGYFDALRQGDLERARRELGLWADNERDVIRKSGERRIEILSVLDARQRKLLGETKPPIAGMPWVKRPSWAAPHAPQAAKPPAP